MGNETVRINCTSYYAEHLAKFLQFTDNLEDFQNSNIVIFLARVERFKQV